MPVIVAIIGSPVISRIASRKNMTANGPKMNWSAPFSSSVLKSIKRVKMSHMMKYAIIALLLSLSMSHHHSSGMTNRATRESQESPYQLNAVASKILPFSHSVYVGDDLHYISIENAHGLDRWGEIVES
jgi:hypothetical protein